MKMGMRKPSIKKSFKARTTSKYKRAAKRAINPTYGKKGMGLINDPKKSVYNKVYNKTTVGLNDVISSSKNKTEDKSILNTEQEVSAVTSPDNDTIYNKNGDLVIIMDTMLLKASEKIDTNINLSFDDISEILIEDNVVTIYDNKNRVFFEGDLTKNNKEKVYKLYKKINKSNNLPYRSYYEVIYDKPRGTSERNLKIFKFAILPLTVIYFLLYLAIQSKWILIVMILFLIIFFNGIRTNDYKN